MVDDEDVKIPLPRPKRAASKIAMRSAISPPFNFRHLSHVGSDFKSEDVKRAIQPMTKLVEIDRLPMAPTLPNPNDGYEKVSPRSSQQSSDLDTESIGSPVPRYENIQRIKAPTLVSAADSYEKASPVSPQQDTDTDSQRSRDSFHTGTIGLDDPIPKVDVSWYQNIAAKDLTKELAIHTYENMKDEESSEMNARISRKKKPAPPPPTVQSPRNSESDGIQNHDQNITWRPQAPTSPPKPLSEHLIRTPEKIEQQSVPSLILERPDVLGEMKLRLDDAIPVSASVSSQASPARMTLRGRSEAKPEMHWMSTLPAEEQKRISGLWEQATGETEVPNDSTTVTKKIALFENRLQKCPPPRPPPPRRHAPPPPIQISAGVDKEQSTMEVEDGGKGDSHADEKMSLTQEIEHKTDVHHGVPNNATNEVKVQGRLPSPFPSSVQQFPIPKPRTRRLEKVAEETSQIKCSETPVLVLPEYITEECHLELYLANPNANRQAGCTVIWRDVVVEKVEATFKACKSRDGDRRPNRTAPVEASHMRDGEENVMVTRF